MDPMYVVLSIGGLILGFVIAWLLQKKRRNDQLEAQREQAAQNHKRLCSQITTLQSQCQDAKEVQNRLLLERDQWIAEKETLEQEIAERKRMVQELTEQLFDFETRFKAQEEASRLQPKSLGHMALKKVSGMVENLQQRVLQQMSDMDLFPSETAEAKKEKSAYAPEDQGPIFPKEDPFARAPKAATKPDPENEVEVISPVAAPNPPAASTTDDSKNEESPAPPAS
ncbi:hypothetical protein ABB02_01332 [Clostridiaceae bacterium JG1575]|nr:hypothetical protein ABB02_01332 [Clostridiaceae bacterium JG1575]